MLTNQEADDLIALPKQIIVGGNALGATMLRLPGGQAKYRLRSDQDEDLSFLMEITQATKGPNKGLKMSLHFQEDDEKIGLLRVDYFGQHQNPSEVTAHLPADLIPYAGMWFRYEDHHIHRYVQGYKNLAWAIPLENDDFPYKQVTARKEVYPVAQAFGARINLQTQFRGYQNALA